MRWKAIRTKRPAAGAAGRFGFRGIGDGDQPLVVLAAAILLALLRGAGGGAP